MKNSKGIKFYNRAWIKFLKQKFTPEEYKEHQRKQRNFRRRQLRRIKKEQENLKKWLGPEMYEYTQKIFKDNNFKITTKATPHSKKKNK